jgi:hypothetical protein
MTGALQEQGLSGAKVKESVKCRRSVQTIITEIV